MRQLYKAKIKRRGGVVEPRHLILGGQNYWVATAEALFWAITTTEVPVTINSLSYEIGEYQIVVWAILENWIRGGILTPDNKIIFSEEALHGNEVDFMVELGLICMCGADLLERGEVNDGFRVWRC